MARSVDRLYRIVQMLRRGRVVTAHHMASELGVSARTVYRDIEHLTASGVPIAGEQGVGYRMRRGFELPPLHFETEELRALVLGARMVAASADAALADAARSALARIDAVLDESRREIVDDVAMFAPSVFVPPGERDRIAILRACVETRRKVVLAYREAEGEPSRRTVRPLGLFFLQGRWYLGGWCELRSALRSFLVARMARI